VDAAGLGRSHRAPGRASRGPPGRANRQLPDAG
jgi:hypothetical protein